MSKRDRCIFFFALLALPSLASPVAAESLCYMQASSGKVVNLGSLCASKPAPTGSAPMTSSSPRVRVQTSDLSNRSHSQENYKIQEGRGGYINRAGQELDYYFQVWSNSSNTQYALKVWEYDNYPNGSGHLVPTTFRSSREAVDYFDCTYTQKRLPACPNNPN